jgi:HEPN domain-containing protein
MVRRVATPHAIPARIRRAVVDLIQPYLRPHELVGVLATTYGFRSIDDLAEALTSAYGDEAARPLRARVKNVRIASYSGRRTSDEDDARNFAEPVLMAVPDEWFATAVEAGREAAIERGFEVMRASEAAQGFDGSIEQLFERNGVPFRFEDGRLVRIGDPVAATQAIQPALGVLEDHRLAESQRHFQEALTDLRRNDPEDAVDEARQAIEAALLAYIEDHGGAKPERHQPNPLFEAAVKVGLPERARELVLGAALYRGRTRAGHAGRPPVPMNDAEAVLASAAASIIFIGRRL